MTYWALMLCWSRYNKSSLDFSLRVVGKYFGQYCSLVYLVYIMYYFLRGASAACIFFSGGPKPPLIKFGIFHQEKTCPPEENKAPPLRKKSAPLKIQSARKFTASPPKRYLGRRVLHMLLKSIFAAKCCCHNGITKFAHKCASHLPGSFHHCRHLLDNWKSDARFYWDLTLKKSESICANKIQAYELVHWLHFSFLSKPTFLCL